MPTLRKSPIIGLHQPMELPPFYCKFITRTNFFLFHDKRLNLLHKLTFLFLCVIAMLGNIVIAMDGKLTLMHTLLGGFEIV